MAVLFEVCDKCIMATTFLVDWLRIALKQDVLYLSSRFSVSLIQERCSNDVAVFSASTKRPR